MVMRGRAVHLNDYSILYIDIIINHKHIFTIDAFPGYIFESAKGIESKLGTNIDVNEWK